MANRLFQQFRFSLEKQVVELWFKATIGASGAPTLVAADSKGVASISRNSAGEYTITLQDTYVKLLDASFCQLLAGGVNAAPVACLQSEAVASTKTIVVQFSSGAGAAADMDSGTVLRGRVTVSNSSAF